MAKKTIQFNLESVNIEDEEQEGPFSANEKQTDKQKKKKPSKFSFFTRQTTNANAFLEPHKTSEANDQRQKTKLVNYLNTEKQIVKKKVKIDTDERQLLDSLGDTVIDLDKYLKFPEAKAKDKLWRIPYFFRDNSNDSNIDEDGLKSINRFGEGINDGCFVSLSLPTKRNKIDKNWEDIFDQADEALEQFERARWSGASVTRARRGSILQPRHIFLSPNPELGNSEKLLLIGHSLTHRDWTSELFLDTESNTLLDGTYKQTLCLNTSLDDLTNMLFPDLKSNMSNYSALTNTEIQYIQTVRNRRRQSLVPPNFDGQGDLRFRRQSFSGGELWSAKIEKDRKREVYHQLVKMINPQFCIIVHEKSELELAMEANQAALYSGLDVSKVPLFDYESPEQARLFAHELTLIVRQHFVAIKESEIVNFITHAGPHVLNRIIRLIATYILRHDELKARTESILFFIKVIRELARLGNWHSVNVIATSLQCPPVVRLKDTWRKITFNYADEYCYFIQISEDLAVGKQLTLYDSLSTFIAIFDDVVDKIKERSGFKIVQIAQHRLHKNWQEKNPQEENIMTWVNGEIVDLLKDINGNLEDKFFETHSFGKKSSIAPMDAVPLPKKPGFFQRLFNWKSTKAAKREESVSSSLAEGDDVFDDGDNQSSSTIYQRRLLPSQIITRQVNVNSKVPSCKKFWSIGEFCKLSNMDKEQVKQEIVRTLVAFQKKTFCVFEERDEEIKQFLLNSECDSMDTCMLKSRSVEGDAKKENAKKESGPRENSGLSIGETSPVNGIITYRVAEPTMPEKEKNTTTETSPISQTPPLRPRTRRVMFAEDLDEPV